MKFLLVMFFIALLVPNVVSAQGGDVIGALLLFFIIGPLIFISVSFSISYFILYLIRQKGHLFLLIADIVLSFVIAILFTKFTSAAHIYTIEIFQKSSLEALAALSFVYIVFILMWFAWAGMISVFAKAFVLDT